MKKLLAFHENGSKNNDMIAGQGTPKNAFELSEAAIIRLEGIIERLGDDMNIAEEERYTKSTTKKKAEVDEENQGKAIQQIALETCIRGENGEQILQNISQNIPLTGISCNPHRRRPRFSKTKDYLHRTLDGRIDSSSTGAPSRSSLSSSQTSIPLRQASQASSNPSTLPTSELSPNSTAADYSSQPLSLPVNQLPSLFYKLTEPRAERHERQLDSIANSMTQAVSLLEEIRDLLHTQSHYSSI